MTKLALNVADMAGSVPTIFCGLTSANVKENLCGRKRKFHYSPHSNFPMKQRFLGFLIFVYSQSGLVVINVFFVHKLANPNSAITMIYQQVCFA